jgi:hypothetical protein
MKKTYKTLSCAVRREDGDAFAAYAAKQGKTVSSLLNEYIRRCLIVPAPGTTATVWELLSVKGAVYNGFTATPDALVSACHLSDSGTRTTERYASEQEAMNAFRSACESCTTVRNGSSILYDAAILACRDIEADIMANETVLSENSVEFYVAPISD